MMQELYSIQETGILLLEICAFLFGLLVLWLFLLAWAEQCKKNSRKPREQTVKNAKKRR